MLAEIILVDEWRSRGHKKEMAMGLKVRDTTVQLAEHQYCEHCRRNGSTEGVGIR